MAFAAVFDANVLYGNEVRDLLMRIALSGAVRAHWTNEILDEMVRNLAANRPDISPDRSAILRDRMNAALSAARADDRHVLAAAIRSGAEVIVTSNLKDFPADVLAAYGVEAKSSDDFVLDQLDLDEDTVRTCVHEIANSRSRPPKTFAAVLDALERAGLVESAAVLRG